MKSLELNWIKNTDKSLVIPNVVFSSITTCSGRYHRRQQSEICVDGKYYDLDFGLIEVSYHFLDDVESTIAHEWRHHWQFCNGYKFNCLFQWPDTFINEDYDNLIIKYFTLNDFEMDALRFEFKKSTPCEQWTQLLYNYICR